MSLLLWEFFWTESDWVAGSTSAAEAVVISRGGSKGSDYHPLPDDFWEARERYIRRFVEPTVRRSREEVPPAPAEQEKQAARLITKATIAQAKLRSLQTERDLLLEKARATHTREELQRSAARILQISLDILAANNQYYEQAAIILLLDIY